jgi:hypothetical protein
VHALNLLRITEYPEVDFTVVVNPNNGPGGPTVPDGNYTATIPKLTAHRNVRVLGYVATTYTKRDIKMVLEDVATYAAWSGMKETHPGLGVRGIFFDETPNQYNAGSVQYLESLKEAVNNSTGLGPDNYVCHLAISRSSFSYPTPLQSLLPLSQPQCHCFPLPRNLPPHPQCRS